jgi:hypothetical protein
MEVGKSGYFDLSETSAGITLRVYWQESYDKSTNKSVITITDLQAKSSMWIGISYFLDGIISVNGTEIMAFNHEDLKYYVYWGTKNTFASVRVQKGGVLPPWISAEISHNADGNKTVSIEVNISGYTSTSGVGSGWNVNGSEGVELTHVDWGVIPIDGELYQGYIDNGTGWDLTLPHIDNGSNFELCSG